MNISSHTYIECLTHALRIESEIDETQEQTFYVDIFNHQYINLSFFARVKRALNFIFNGVPIHDEIILTPKVAKKLANFINNNTQSNKAS